jgi:hypothetical protein
VWEFYTSVHVIRARSVCYPDNFLKIFSFPFTFAFFGGRRGFHILILSSCIYVICGMCRKIKSLSRPDSGGDRDIRNR